MKLPQCWKNYMERITIKIKKHQSNSLLSSFPLIIYLICAMLLYRIEDKMLQNDITSDMDKDKFREFVKKHQGLLFPAFEVQRILRKKCLGKRFWKSYASRRVELTKGKYLTTSQLIELVNRGTLEKSLSELVLAGLAHGNSSSTLLNSIDVSRLAATKGTHNSRRRLSVGGAGAGNGVCDTAHVSRETSFRRDSKSSCGSDSNSEVGDHHNHQLLRDADVRRNSKDKGTSTISTSKVYPHQSVPMDESLLQYKDETFILTTHKTNKVTHSNSASVSPLTSPLTLNGTSNIVVTNNLSLGSVSRRNTVHTVHGSAVSDSSQPKSKDRRHTFSNAKDFSTDKIKAKKLAVSMNPSIIEENEENASSVKAAGVSNNEGDAADGKSKLFIHAPMQKVSSLYRIHTNSFRDNENHIANAAKRRKSFAIMK